MAYQHRRTVLFRNTLPCIQRSQCVVKRDCSYQMKGVMHFSSSSSSSCVHQNRISGLEETLQTSHCIHEILSTWYTNRHTVPPEMTFKYLLLATKMIRKERQYNHYSSHHFKTLLNTTMDVISSLDAEKQVTLLWQTVKMKRKPKTYFLDKLTSNLTDQVCNLSDKSLGLVPWALVSLNRHNNYISLMNAVIKEILVRLKNDSFLDARAFANICWSFSVIKKWPSELTPHVIAFLKDKYCELSPHSLSIFLLSLNRAGIEFEEWLLKATCEASQRFEKIDSQSLSLFIWTLGHNKHYDQQYFTALTNEILSGKLIPKYSPRLLATFLWCFARVRYYQSDLLDHLSKHVLNMLDKMNIHDLTNIAYAYSFLNHPHSDLLLAISDRVISLYEDTVNPQSIMNVSWACLVADIYPLTLLEQCLNQRMVEGTYIIISSQIKNIDDNILSIFALVHVSRLVVDLVCMLVLFYYFTLLDIIRNNKERYYCRQMLQLDLASRTEHPDMKLPCLSSQHRAVIQKDIMTYVRQDSIFQRNLKNCLHDMYGGRQYLNSESFSISGYTIDIELLLGKETPVVFNNDWSIETVGQLYRCKMECDDRGVTFDYKMYKEKTDPEADNTRSSDDIIRLASDWNVGDSNITHRIAIEADGPLHFCINCNHPLGRTVLKHRQLRALGWKVLSVSFEIFSLMMLGVFSSCRFRILNGKN